MNQNPRRQSIQTSVYSEYEQSAGKSKTLVTEWLEKLKRPQSFIDSSRQNYELPRFGRANRHNVNSIENFTLGQVDSLGELSSERLETFPNNSPGNLRSLQRPIDRDKQNMSINSNLLPGREPQQSKSFINAMRALQDKCRRIDDQKTKLAEAYSTLQISTAKQLEQANKITKQLQTDIEQRNLELIQLKSRITLFEKTAVDSDKLIKQNDRLKEEKQRFQRKTSQSEKLCLELSEKYSQIMKQYEQQCRISTEYEQKLKQFEQQLTDSKFECRSLRQKLSKVQKFESEGKSQLIDRYNSIVKRNEELTKVLKDKEKQLNQEKQTFKSEVKRITENSQNEDKKRQSETKQIRKNKENLQQKVAALEKQHEYLRGQLDKKNQEMLDLMKSVMRKPESIIESRVEQKVNELPSSQHILNRMIQDGYRSTGSENRVTSRFQEKPTNLVKSQSKTKDSRVKKENKQKSLEKSRSKHSEYKSHSKSVVYSKRQDEKSEDPMISSNLVTFENPFGKISNKKQSRRVVYATSQPRQHIRHDQEQYVAQFNPLHSSQYCEVHNLPHFHQEQPETTPDINKLMLIQAQKQGLILIEQHQQLLMASKDYTNSARAQYIGRLKQLNEMMKLNGDKICQLKMACRNSEK